MGIYNNNLIGSELNTDTLIECYEEPGIEGACAIVAESEMNYNKIMQAVGIAELNYFAENGQEMVYEAGTASAFIEKAKQFFKNIWEKIKGLFKKFFSMFDSYVKSDKDFVNKYKKHLLSVDTRNFKYKGYQFDKLNIDLEKCASSAITSLPANYSDKMDRNDEIEKARAAAIGKSSGLTASEFTKELFMLFRKGEDAKIDLENISVSEQLSHISGSSALKKNAEKNYKDLEKTINNNIKKLNNIEKELVKLVPGKDDVSADIKQANHGIWAMKEALNITQLINGANLTAIKDQNRQAKAICVKLMNYKAKNESTDFGGGAGSSFLEAVTIQ